VEALDEFGNRAIGTLNYTPSECTAHVFYVPIVSK
jgi:hypothetical protein